MVDPTDDIDVDIDVSPEHKEQIDMIADALGNLGGSAGGAALQVDKLLNIVGNMPKSEATRDLENGLKKLQGEYRKTGDAHRGLNEIVGSGFDTSGIMRVVDQGIGPALVDVNRKFINLQRAAKEMKETSETQFDEVGKAAKSLGAIGFMGLRKKAVEALDKIHFNKLQQDIYDVRKRALQTGMAFGETFDTAEKSAEGFSVSLLKTITTTRSTRDEVLGVRKAMEDAFAARETFDAITSLQGAMTGVQSAIDLTNVALTVATATGTDHTKVAGMMASAHLDLGLSVEDTALSMGSIADAAKGSGLHFKNVADTIVGSAKALKFYGTTIEAVNPLFKTFNQSLAGIGREGLTPDLLNKFVGGIQKMSFSTRALLGLSVPGGPAGGGILGGGLRMEQALQTGEGMGDIAQSISETMKKFGGGPVITREEAIETGRERDYMIQRQILGQLTGINDPGEANMMMGILQDIDRHGMAGSADSVSKLKEMMQKGEEVAEKTTTDLKKAELEFYSTTIGQGKELIDIGKRMLGEIDEIGVRDFASKIFDVTKTIAGGGIGEINLETLEGSLGTLGNEAAELASQLENWQGTEKEKKVVQERLGEVRGEMTEQQVTADYKREIMEALKAGDEKQRTQYARTGVAPEEIHEQVWEKVTKGLDKAQQKKLEGRGGLERALRIEDRPEKAAGIRGEQRRKRFTLAARRERRQRQFERAEEMDVTLPGQRPTGTMELARREAERKEQLRGRGLTEKQVEARIRAESATTRPGVLTTAQIRRESERERGRPRRPRAPAVREREQERRPRAPAVREREQERRPRAPAVRQELPPSEKENRKDVQELPPSEKENRKDARKELLPSEKENRKDVRKELLNRKQPEI
jgi:hypothetical protein